MKKLKGLQLEKAIQSERSEKLRGVLARAKQVERRTQAGSKRKDAYALTQYLAVSHLSADTIRHLDQFHTRSYNLGKQVQSLVDHLFVRYRVPLFLYRSMLSWKGLEALFDGTTLPPKGESIEEWAYRPWFLAVARGDSFAKASAIVFTKKEAHWFLLAPEGHSIRQNIYWAKAAAAGLPRDACDFLVDRLSLATWDRVGGRLPDLLRFYLGAWPEMGRYDRDEITDFVIAMILRPAFSFKGRTFGSMRKLSHEWHRFSYANSVRVFRSWTQTLPNWESRKGRCAVQAMELANNRALAEEGRKQRHCVGSYTHRCLEGMSRIVSLRWYELTARDADCVLETARLTIEIDPRRRQVVQIRGPVNSLPTTEQMKIVGLWAGELGLVV